IAPPVRRPAARCASPAARGPVAGAVPAVVVVLAALIGLSGCTGSTGDSATAPGAAATDSAAAEGEGARSDRAGDRAIDLDRAASDARELLRALRMSHVRVGSVLGAHRIECTASVEVKAGAEVLDQLTVTTALDYADSGEFRGVLENSADYGREIIYTDGLLYLAPRYGLFHRRPPEHQDEPVELRDQLFGELAAHVEVLAGGLAVSAAAPAEHGGRSARTVTLAAAATQRPPSGTDRPGAAWRDSIRVTEASGTIALDSETGIPLHATVRGAAAASESGRALTVTVAVDYRVIRGGQAVAIAAPPGERWLDTPLRSREIDQRETLLRGIAPPRKRTSAPAPSTPAKGSK
ncbi:MAG: hypothetical protein AAGC55_23260, partial [Myxococcota bacterium]